MIGLYWITIYNKHCWECDINHGTKITICNASIGGIFLAEVRYLEWSNKSIITSSLKCKRKK